MNPLHSRNRTMGELMTELRARLGFVSAGPAAKNNEVVIKSFLQEAHEYVYGELEPASSTKRAVIRVTRGSRLYDWNNDDEDEPIDPGMVKAVYIRRGELLSDPLPQGITEAHRELAENWSEPTRYDTTNGQIELAPTPDQSYDLVVEYTPVMGRFDRQSDRPSVPHRLVFLYALANAKAHYRHPDAQASATTFQNMLTKAKVRNKENRRYFAGSREPHESHVVRTSTGYSLKVK